MSSKVETDVIDKIRTYQSLFVLFRLYISSKYRYYGTFQLTYFVGVVRSLNLLGV